MQFLIYKFDTWRQIPNTNPVFFREINDSVPVCAQIQILSRCIDVPGKNVVFLMKSGSLKSWNCFGIPLNCH